MGDDKNYNNPSNGALNDTTKDTPIPSPLSLIFNIQHTIQLLRKTSHTFSNIKNFNVSYNSASVKAVGYFVRDT